MSTGVFNPNFQSSSSTKTQQVFVGPQTAADEGSYFVATNPTAGTAIATTTSVVDDAATASSTHAQASPVMVISNQWPVGDANQKSIYLDYLKMLISQVPTSATSWQCAMRLDFNPTRVTTAGTSIVPVNINSGSGTTSRANIQFGAITTALPTVNGRLVHRSQINSAVPVTLDQWFFSFDGGLNQGSVISGGTGAKNIQIPGGPIVIGPGWSLTIEMWGPSNAAAPSWEFELGYIERPTGQ